MHDESDEPSVAQGVQSHTYWFEWFWWSVPLQPFYVVDVELYASRCKLLRANTGKVMVVTPVERDVDLNESHARGEKQIVENRGGLGEGSDTQARQNVGHRVFSQIFRSLKCMSCVIYYSGQ